MFWKKRLITAVIFLVPFAVAVQGQIIYFNDINGNVYELDVQSCESTLVASGPVFNDMAVGPGGLLYGLFGLDVYEIDPASGSNTLIGSIPPDNFAVTGLEIGPDGQVYIIGVEVWALNPSSGVLVNNGPLPPDWFCIGDLVYFEGQYYGAIWVGDAGNPQLAIIDVQNPSNSSLVTPLPETFLVGGASVFDPDCPRMYWFNTPSLVDPSGLWQFDVNSQSWSAICPNFPFTVGGADTPNDYAFPISCSCETDAGTISGSAQVVCLPAGITFSHNGDATLEPDDVLGFILFSNESDPLGSVIASASSPAFAFNPSLMVAGQTYYVAAVAGNNLNGFPDLADPCLDLSDVFEVVWRPLPTVQLTMFNAVVCTAGCTAFSAAFQGTPPFELMFTYSFGGGATFVFNEPSANFQICLPDGVPPGEAVLQVVSLRDLYCWCP